MKIPILEEKPNKTYTASGYIKILDITKEQALLIKKIAEENIEKEFFRKLEEEYKDSILKLTYKELLNIFPEAVSGYIVPKIKELKEAIKKTEEQIKKCLKIVREKSKPENHWFWEMVITVLDTSQLVEIEKQIKHFTLLLNLTKNMTKEQPIKPKNLITDEMVKRAEERPIEDVISNIIKLKKRGENLIGLCPFHNEKTPSFTVYTKTNSFYCFGCQKSGNTIKFVMEYHGLSFRDAIKLLTN